MGAHIDNIERAVRAWLDPENGRLQKAIQRTVEEGLFSEKDIQFQLDVFRRNLENGDLKEWVERSGVTNKHSAHDKKVLCLHAGNLPLVGFQTALGVILSGANYYGKLSRKDPYLLASFLDELKDQDFRQEIHYSTELQSFRDLNAETVIFAGSEASVLKVKDEIQRNQAAQTQARFIIRTAKFSIVYLDNWNGTIKEQLVEGMLRYGGNGCRSVAMVVATFGLDEVKEELRSAVQEYWKINTQHQKPAPELNYQYAYNESIQRSQLWLKDFLIQESDTFPETNFCVNWVEGNVEKVRALRMQFGKAVQSLYSMNEIDGLKTEQLKTAQRPPMYWRPDGVDVIEELVE